MPTLLDATQVTDTLRSLPGWQGGPERIWRDVQLPADQDTELRRQIAVDADAMGHHPVLEDVDKGTRFVLWTHSAGGVTELDIVLASHISDLLHRLSGQQGVDAVRAGEAVVTVRNAEGADEPDGDAPTMGVAGVAGGSTPRTPLPDARPGSPEPGVSPEQQPGG